MRIERSRRIVVDEAAIDAFKDESIGPWADVLRKIGLDIQSGGPGYWITSLEVLVPGKAELPRRKTDGERARGERRCPVQIPIAQL